jgi:superfamily II DNA/RNA helicase
LKLKRLNDPAYMPPKYTLHTPSKIEINGGFRSLGVASHIWPKLSTYLKIVNPTDIQKAAIPALTKQESIPGDLIIQDMTGSGKTLAYLLPILTNINNFEKSLQAVIVAPTRELSMQIYKLALTLNQGGSKKRRANPVTIFRAVGRVDQAMHNNLSTHTPHLLIGTPRTLRTLLIDRPISSTLKMKYFVIDEVDFLCEGEHLQITEDFLVYLFGGARNASMHRIRLVLASATISKKVREVAAKFMFRAQLATASGLRRFFEPGDSIELMATKLPEQLELACEIFKPTLPASMKHFYVDLISASTESADRASLEHLPTMEAAAQGKILRQLCAVIKPRVAQVQRFRSWLVCIYVIHLFL